MTQESAGCALPGPRKTLKRSLFNRPAWVKTSSTEDEDIFHRSNRKYAGIDSDNIKRTRIEENLTKPSQEAKLSASKTSAQLLSAEDNNKDRSGNPPAKVETCPQLEVPVQSSSLRERYEEDLCAAKLLGGRVSSALEPLIIDLEDEEDLEEVTRAKVAVDHPNPSPHRSSGLNAGNLEPEDVDADEEFPELARKAREKARKQYLQQDLVQAEDVSNCNIETNLVDAGSRATRTQESPPTSSDPNVQILVTSKIQSSRPLIVTRKFSQRLKDVRLAWIKYQNIPDPAIHQTFLTWRGKRLFDVTSCKSLGLHVDSEGVIAFQGDPLGNENQIHMIAMTTEQYERYKKAKEDPELGDEDGDNHDQELPENPQQSDPEVRIILKSKSLTDFKLKVRPVSHSHGFYQHLSAIDKF